MILPSEQAALSDAPAHKGAARRIRLTGVIGLSEDLVPWRLFAADVLMGGTAALLGYWVFHWLAARSRTNAGGAQRFVRHAWIILVVGVLLSRHLYGPPLRLLLTSKRDRPAQRFADRVARSAEIRAWYERRTAELRAGGESEEMVPRTLGYERSELVRNGLQRLGDAQLRLRTDLLAQAFANVEQYWPCATILVGGERAIPDVLARFQPAAGDAWFDLIYDAMIAEVRASPPQRRLTDEQKTVVLADIGSSARPRRHLFDRAPRESGSGDMLERCARERQLYATVNAWEGPRRAAADLLLTTADSFVVGDLEGESQR
jgi:hypothetical protein